MAEFVTAGKYNIDRFAVDTVYWRKPKNSAKLVTGLVMSSVLSFICLHLIHLRYFVCLALWCTVGYNSQFCCDIANIFRIAIGEYDIRPLETYVYAKTEELVLTFRKYFQKTYSVYCFVTCKRTRQIWRERRGPAAEA